MKSNYIKLRSILLALAFMTTQISSANAIESSNNKVISKNFKAAHIDTELRNKCPFVRDYLFTYVKNTKDNFARNWDINYQIINRGDNNQLVIYYGTFATVLDIEKINKSEDGKNIRVEVLNGLSILLPTKIQLDVKNSNETTEEIVESTVGPYAIINHPQSETSYQDYISDVYRNNYSEIYSKITSYNKVIPFGDFGDENAQIVDVCGMKENGDGTIAILTPYNKVINIDPEKTMFINDMNTTYSTNQLITTIMGGDYNSPNLNNDFYDRAI